MEQPNRTSERVAVAILADGRRVTVRVPGRCLVGVSPVEAIRLIGREALFLITGSRREPDGGRAGRR